MPYIPRAEECWNALRQALQDGFNAELEAIGERAMPMSGFEVRDPQLMKGESVVVFYDHTEKGALLNYVVKVQWVFGVHLRTIQPDDLSLNTRLMRMEFAATQALQKRNTLNGLLRTLEVGDPVPWGISKGGQGAVADSLILPVRCQPDVEVANPERSIP